MQHPGGQGSVIVIAAQRRVTAGGDDLEHTLGEAQDGDIKRAATEVVDGVNALARVVQPVGDGGSGGFVDQAQHVQAGQLRGVLGRLALGIVEIGRHRDDDAVQVVVERVFSAVAQRGQDFGAHLHRGLLTLDGLQTQHARMVHKAVWQLGSPMHVLQTAPHETFDRGDGVFRVQRQRLLRLKPDLTTVTCEVANHRRQHDPPLRVRQTFGHAMTHGGHQGMGGAQIDAHRHAPLVRVGRLTGFGDLQKRHVLLNRNQGAIVPAANCPSGRGGLPHHRQIAR